MSTVLKMKITKCLGCGGVWTVADLSNSTGIAKSTVRVLLRELEGDGSAVRAEKGSNSVGRSHKEAL